MVPRGIHFSMCVFTSIIAFETHTLIKMALSVNTSAVVRDGRKSRTSKHNTKDHNEIEVSSTTHGLLSNIQESRKENDVLLPMTQHGVSDGTTVNTSNLHVGTSVSPRMPTGHRLTGNGHDISARESYGTGDKDKSQRNSYVHGSSTMTGRSTGRMSLGGKNSHKIIPMPQFVSDIENQNRQLQHNNLTRQPYDQQQSSNAVPPQQGSYVSVDMTSAAVSHVQMSPYGSPRETLSSYSQNTQEANTNTQQKLEDVHESAVTG
jgi:hypothetical protein